MSDLLFWAHKPRDHHQKYHIQLVTPKGLQVVHAVLLSDIVTECFFHWTGKTVPCLKEVCHLCSHLNLPRRSKFYLPAIAQTTGDKIILELSEMAITPIDERIVACLPLRGQVVLAQRKDRRKNAPIKVELKGRYKHMDKLPDSFDPTPILMRFWDISGRLASNDLKAYNESA